MMRPRALLVLTGVSLLASAAAAQAVGPDAYGYTANPVGNNFFDISGIGTDITGALIPSTGLYSALDEGGLFVPIGFAFNFYGTNSTAIAMGSNGRFVVVWQDDNDQNGYYQIYARVFHANGASHISDFTVNSDSRPP